MDKKLLAMLHSNLIFMAVIPHLTYISIICSQDAQETSWVKLNLGEMLALSAQRHINVCLTYFATFVAWSVALSRTCLCLFITQMQGRFNCPPHGWVTTTRGIIIGRVGHKWVAYVHIYIYIHCVRSFGNNHDHGTADLNIRNFCYRTGLFNLLAYHWYNKVRLSNVF